MDRSANRSVRIGPHSFSWKPDPYSAAVDAFCQDWSSTGLYAFPPFCLVSQCLSKRQSCKDNLILVAPVWPSQPWYASLLLLSVAEPRILPSLQDLLQNSLQHRHPLLEEGNLSLAAWKVSSSQLTIEAFQNSLALPQRCRTLRLPTLLPDVGKAAGVVKERLTRFVPL